MIELTFNLHFCLTMINKVNMTFYAQLGITAILTASLLTACGGDDGNKKTGNERTAPGAPAAQEESAAPDLITADQITLGDIDNGLVEKGRSIYDVKCQACHSTGPNRVVGPGWKGITERRQPEWIMNMILNVDVMLATDPEAQKQLEECLVRMPNQGLNFDEGRQVLEFMRTL